MHLRSSHWLVSPLVALTLAACGGTVVFEEDGGSDGGGGAGDGTTSGFGGAPTTTSTTSGNTGTPSSSALSSTGSSPSSVTVGQSVGQSVGVVSAVAVSTGGSSCDGQLFADPDLDECGRNFCCAEMGVCMNDPFRCFNEKTGELSTDLPDGAALFECLTGSGCVDLGDGNICDSGISFGKDADPATLQLAQCLSDNCCDEFNFCTDDGNDAGLCVDCLNGQTPDDDLCSPARECANKICDAGI